MDSSLLLPASSPSADLREIRPGGGRTRFVTLSYPFTTVTSLYLLLLRTTFLHSSNSGCYYYKTTFLFLSILLLSPSLPPPSSRAPSSYMIHSGIPLVTTLFRFYSMCRRRRRSFLQSSSSSFFFFWRRAAVAYEIHPPSPCPPRRPLSLSIVCLYMCV